MEVNIPKKQPICWEIILDKLDHAADQDSISLVCKEFLSVTNSIRDTIAVVNPSIHVLTRLLQRFPHLKKIQLVNFLGDLNEAILEIAQSGLKIEELDVSCTTDLRVVCLENLSSRMKNLKILCCSRSSLTDTDIVRISNLFPQLEELDISESLFPNIVDGKITAVTDEGIEYLTSKLKRLRRINVLGNQHISDKSLISLASNCALLQQVVAGYGRGVTRYGVSFLLHNSPHLTSLVLNAYIKIDPFVVNGSADLPKYLQSLHLTSVTVSDEFLHSVAQAHIPLTEFCLSYCKSYTFTGISSLLHSYQSLKSLALIGASFLTNKHIDYLSPFLLNLISIQLSFCPFITDLAFDMLSERCPLLSRLEVSNSCLGREKQRNNSPVMNFTIHSLNISSNSFLDSSCLRRVLNICPNIEKLHLSACFQFPGQLNIADILDCSGSVKSLELNRCNHLTFSGEKANISRLERIAAVCSGINDDVLTMIGMKSPGLLHLDLRDCRNITEKGVKEVVKFCTRLRYLNLSGCINVNVDVVQHIVNNRPSVRWLVSPSRLYPEKEDQECLLQQGCVVTRGVC
ncbi:hypothetical protein vseg_004945 [Gypsophila vaccaria]